MRTPGYLSVVALLAASLSVGYAESVSGPEVIPAPEVVPAPEGEPETAEEEASGGALATFEGRVIDLSQGWDGATACMYDPATMTMAECFSSEAEMDLRLGAIDTSFDPRSSLRADPQLAFASCSSYLRLYDGTWYSGAVLHLATRGYWHNLSWYGFNQRTSSYRIGGCSALFADWSNGGGGFYPTWLTQAWDRSGSMIYGWNNDVSSVFIY